MCGLMATCSPQHPELRMNSALPHVPGGSCHDVEGFRNVTKAALLEMGRQTPRAVCLTPVAWAPSCAARHSLSGCLGRVPRPLRRI